ncbi:hypothetical protein Q5P01_021680 [Channa striata]|uniref:HIT-type domain-containing protein n=1 Tax=Channa striata TaxID=64152 RepID=A0AA88LUN9_CHASR|nr:hypothetical protein Q5P01_021680 [Channa striata]
MNPLIRRRLPPSVRSLLTDIGPKQAWTETEPDTVTRDGILLPSRAAACEQEEFLTPAKTEKEEEEAAEEAAEDASNARTNALCMLCKSKPSCYTCPRCNLHYCGLTCYQSPDHSVCSEEFYKESVLQELKNMGKTETEGKKKMLEILVGLRQNAKRTEGGIESLLKEAGIVAHDTDAEEEETTEKVQVLELLSRLAELQQSGEGSETEIEDILRKLEDIGGGELPPGDIDDDTANVEKELDLADRISELDIDKLSEEELWELLNSKEKETFISLMKGGAIGQLVPLWKPWWEKHEEVGRPLVEPLAEVNKPKTENVTTMDEQEFDSIVKTSEEMVQKQENTSAKRRKNKGGSSKQTIKSESSKSGLSHVPPISAKIPKLSSLCANPSPLVCYSLVNALFGYSFTLSFLNGDTDALMFEFCDMVLALSEALNSSRVFNSVQEALDCAETQILSGGYLDKEDPMASVRAVEAVAHIMTGRDRKDIIGYCLAALSQIRSVLSQARAALSKEGEEGARRQKYFLASKKCEFFQAWVLDNTHQIHRLTIELWNEHSRKESSRISINKAKTVVEEKLKKGKRKENNKLIEELS